MQSEDSLDYWICDETGFEVIYYSIDNEFTHKNYKLWTDILAAGKRIWAIAGGDGHAACWDGALTTIFAKELSSAGLLEYLRKGDFVCGPVEIRMCIGNQAMGGVCDFNGQRLVVSVGDFHKSVLYPTHNYRMDILDDKGVVFSAPVAVEKIYHPVDFANKVQQGPDKLSAKECNFAIDVNADAKFYHVEIFDETKNWRIAIGNPIWNSKFYK